MKTYIQIKNSEVKYGDEYLYDKNGNKIWIRETKLIDILLDFLKFHYRDNRFRREKTNFKDAESYITSKRI